MVRSSVPTAARRGLSSSSRGSIKKASRTHALVGRRVNVPQRFTEVPDDGDGFTFGAVILTVAETLATIRFDYTGEVERWPLGLVRQWLDFDDEPLCNLMERSRVAHE